MRIAHSPALVILGILSLAGRSEAAIIIQFEEIGGNVIAKTSGNLTVPSVAPYYHQASGDFLGGGDLDLYHMNNGFTQWRDSGAESFSAGLSTSPTSAVGDTLGYSGINLFLPLGLTAGNTYTPDTTWTWEGQTLESIGLEDLTTTPFSVFDGFGVTISFVAVPEPSMTILMGAGALGLVSRRRFRMG